jgi:hypothetical protein
MHPFLNVTKLSDDEIIDQLNKAYGYMQAQIGLGSTPAVQSIKEVVQALENERRERQLRQSDAEYDKKYPDKNKPLEFGKLDD